MTYPILGSDDAYRQRARQIASGVRAPIPGPVAPRTNMETYTPQYRGNADDAEESLSLGGIGSKIIDILSRGVYASAGFSKSYVKNIQHDDDAGNPFVAGWEGLTGETPTTYSDVIEEIDPNAPGAVKFIGGLAGDILLDPANLLLGGATAGIRAGIKAAKAPAEAAKAAEKAANAAAPALTANEIKGMPRVAMNVRADVDMNGRIAHMLDPLRRKTKAGYGFEDMHNAMRSGFSTGEEAVTLFRSRYLSPVAKKYGGQTINDAYSAARRGVVPKDPETAAAFDEVLKGMDRLVNAKDPELRRLFEGPGGVAALNKAMKSKGISHQFDITKGMTLPRGVGNTHVPAQLDPDKLAKQWKDWDVTDPFDFMDRMHQAVVESKVKQAFGDSVIKNFAKTTARPGHVKLTKLKDTELGPYIQNAMGKTPMYMDKDVAEQLTRVNHWLTEPTSFKDSTTKIGFVVRNVVNPVMNIWKPYMTIMRPAHHVRNLYSDVILSSMDGVINPGVYVKAKNMLGMGGAIERTGLSGLKELEAGAQAGITSGGKKMSTVRLKGKNADLSGDNMYKLGWNEGLFPNHHVTEDFFDDPNMLSQSANPTKKTITQLALNNPAMRAAGKVSEQTNHFTRGAHFIALMERKKFTRQFDTMEEAAHAAAIRVKKFHPDVTGLAPWERKNMRQLFPFYSWIRQALPTIINGTLSKPGRTTAIPKAGFELSKAMGMDPQSIGDPFPDRGIYPEFVHENLIGPIANTGWGQIGANTGSPAEAVFGDILNGNPIRNVAGMGNPIFQAIVEAGFGTSLATGKPVFNKSENLDQQLPIINHLSKISGYSPTSIIQNIIQGEGLKLNENLARDRGTYNPGMSILNALSGVSLSNLQSSTYKNIAGKEIKE